MGWLSSSSYRLVTLCHLTHDYQEVKERSQPSCEYGSSPSAAHTSVTAVTELRYCLGTLNSYIAVCWWGWQNLLWERNSFRFNFSVAEFQPFSLPPIFHSCFVSMIQSLAGFKCKFTYSACVSISVGSMHDTIKYWTSKNISMYGVCLCVSMQEQDKTISIFLLCLQMQNHGESIWL